MVENMTSINKSQR